jgi:hypothetical protein
MKPRSVKVRTIEVKPWEVSTFPDGGFMCEVDAQYPNGQILTRVTGLYATPDGAWEQARQLKKQLWDTEIEETNV